MSTGSPRIVVRLSPEEMVFVQAAADTISVSIKRLAKMGVLREAMDVRNKLVDELNTKFKGTINAEADGAPQSSDTLQDGQSPGLQGNPLDHGT